MRNKNPAASFSSSSPLAKGNALELGLSAAALDDIVAKKMRVIEFDPQDAYDKLSSANQSALAHLVRASTILDTVFHKQDHPANIAAKKALEKEAAKKSVAAIYAQNALSLFTVFNGAEGIDMYAQKGRPLRLLKNHELQPGKGFYPQDITKKELAAYIVKHPEQAAALLGNNTVVYRDGKRLVAEPYSVAFRTEMEQAARQLQLAASATDHVGFADYLRWHAQALVNDSDPEAMFKADKLWVDLEDSPLEFTIGRENYQDDLSADVAAVPAVAAVLKAAGINAKQKDTIGIRVGIVNLKSYGQIARYRQQLGAMSELMPLREQYRAQADTACEQKMTFADVDLVSLTGDYAAVRTGMVMAQNLPNSDKLATQLDAGSRMVFHRQARAGRHDPVQHQKFLDALVIPEQQGLYDDNADFLFTIGHEMGHSLGPRASLDGRDKHTALGKWGGVLEENKADLVSVVMADYFQGIGTFTAEQANKIYLTWAADGLLPKQPSDGETHRMRAVMQHNYFCEKGAINFEAGGKLSIVPERMAKTARAMLTEVIAMQLEGDPAKAEGFVKKYATWDSALQYAADTQMALKPRLYRLVKQPMRDRLAL